MSTANVATDDIEYGPFGPTDFNHLKSIFNKYKVDMKMLEASPLDTALPSAPDVSETEKAAFRKKYMNGASFPSGSAIFVSDKENIPKTMRKIPASASIRVQHQPKSIMVAGVKK